MIRPSPRTLYALIQGNEIVKVDVLRRLFPGVTSIDSLTTLQSTFLDEDPQSISDSPEVLEVLSELPFDSATEKLQRTEPYLLEGKVYNVEVVPKSPAPLAPRWIEFGNAVMASPTVNAMLGTAFQTAPALFSGLSVGLGKAADGDSRVFVASWQTAIAVGLVNEALIEEMQGLATTYSLPMEFIAALSAIN